MLWTGCWETLGSDDVDGTNLCSAHLREEESSLGQGMSNKAIQCLWGRFKFELLNSSKLLLTYSWCDCDSQMVVDRTSLVVWNSCHSLRNLEQVKSCRPIPHVTTAPHNVTAANALSVAQICRTPLANRCETWHSGATVWWWAHFYW